MRALGYLVPAGGQGGVGGNGGVLYRQSSPTFNSCTFANNMGGRRGQGGMGGAGNTPLLAAGNSAAAGGPAGAGGSGSPPGGSGSPGSSGLDGSGPNLFGAFTSNGHNLIGLDDGNTGFIDGLLGDLVGSGTPLNPRVGLLSNNGAPTSTCALLSGSAVLNTRDDFILDAPLGLTTDQRCLPRRTGLHVDIRALETQWASDPICVAACARTSDAAVQLTLTNLPGASLTLLAATDPSLPLSALTVLGPIPEISPGQFQFIDSAPTNLRQRIYRVRCP